MNEVHSTISTATPVSMFTIGACLFAFAMLLALSRWLFGPSASRANSWKLLLLRAIVFAVLLLILWNPVRMDTRPGDIERPKVVFLLDASQSMSLGQNTRRWDDAVRMIRQVSGYDATPGQPNIETYCFGQKLAAVDRQASLSSSSQAGDKMGTSTPLGPRDTETRLAMALRLLPGRFGSHTPRMIVVFSDGRVQDPAGLRDIAAHYARLSVPIHVVPCGSTEGQGDIAIESLVAPEVTRKNSQLTVQLYVRSFGFDGRRSEVRLEAIDDEDRVVRLLDRRPITLRSGVQPYSLSFRTDDKSVRLKGSIEVLPNEISANNNSMTADVFVDRTKIRVLHIVDAPGAQAAVPGTGSFLQSALDADEDIETIIALPLVTNAGKRWSFSGDVLAASTSIELNAFDAVVLGGLSLGEMPTDLPDSIENFVAQRGGGFCMLGGPGSFCAGQWNGSIFEKLSPLEFHDAHADWQPTMGKIHIVAESEKHPLWRFVADPRENEAILGDLPLYQGLNRLGPSKPGATVLADGELSGVSPAWPIIAVQPFGRGRTMAVATPLTGPRIRAAGSAQADGSAQFARHFWLSTIYWLTENSQIGRRRLVVETDKRLYRPGEKILVRAETYDSVGAQTAKYRLTATVEPDTMLADVDQVLSPITRYLGDRPAMESSGRFLAWGEEMPMSVRADAVTFETVLQIGDEADVREFAATSVHAVRVEVTAFDEYAPVDSTSVSLQILNDPDEFQTPLPNHAVLEALAKTSRGEVLRDARAIADRIRHLGVTEGPAKVAQFPILNNAWVLVLLLTALTCDWVWRRMSGLG